MVSSFMFKVCGLLLIFEFVLVFGTRILEIVSGEW